MTAAAKRNGAALTAPGIATAAGTPRAPAVAVLLSRARRCTCGVGPILHAGTKGDGPSLIPGSTCTAYQEADRD